MEVEHHIAWVIGTACIVVAAILLGGAGHGVDYGIGVAGISICLHVYMDAVCNAIREGR